MRKIKFKRFHLFNVLLYLLICIMCFVSLCIINIANKMENDIKTNIEDNYRTETRRILEYFSSQLHTDIKSGKVNIWDDKELQYWFNTTLMNLRYSGTESFKMAINIGYSFKNPDDEVLNEICTEAGLTSEEANSFKLAFVNLSLNGKSNEEIQTEIKQKINFKNNFDVLNIFRNALFEKNKVITTNKKIDTNNLSSLIFRINQSESGDNIVFQEGEQNLWIEWRSVPLTFLGFDGQSAENGDNINYKKLVIIIGINEQETLSPFEQIFKDIASTELYSKLLLIITFLAVAILLTYKFIKTIKDDDRDNQEGDNNELI